jgi:hypothetical protein
MKSTTWCCSLESAGVAGAGPGVKGGSGLIALTGSVGASGATGTIATFMEASASSGWPATGTGGGLKGGINGGKGTSPSKSPTTSGAIISAQQENPDRFVCSDKWPLAILRSRIHYPLFRLQGRQG